MGIDSHCFIYLLLLSLLLPFHDHHSIPANSPLLSLPPHMHPLFAGLCDGLHTLSSLLLRKLQHSKTLENEILAIGSSDEIDRFVCDGEFEVA